MKKRRRTHISSNGKSKRKCCYVQLCLTTNWLVGLAGNYLVVACRQLVAHDPEPVVVCRQLVAHDSGRVVVCWQLVAHDSGTVVVYRQLVAQDSGTVVVCRQLVAQDSEPVVVCWQLVAQDSEPRVVWQSTTNYRSCTGCAKFTTLNTDLNCLMSWVFLNQ